jgi:hypothetical protein
MQQTILFIASTLGFLALAIFLSYLRYEDKGEFIRHMAFAIHALFLSQIMFVATFIGIGLWTGDLGGYFIWGAGPLVFFSYATGIPVFLITLLGFKQRQRQEHPFLTISKAAFSFILLFAFFSLGGMGYTMNVIAKITLLTNFDSLVELQKHNFQKDALYADIAEDTNELSQCDKITVPLQKASCYLKSDPEFEQYAEDCTLYTKHGYIEIAHGFQRGCITQKYISEHFENEEDINCNMVAETYSQNQYINEIVERCRPLEILQNIITSGDPAKCVGFLQKPLSLDYWADHYMACIGNFVESEEWQRACDTYTVYDERGIIRGRYLLALARCVDEDGNTFSSEISADTLRLFMSGYPAKYNEIG